MFVQKDWVLNPHHGSGSDVVTTRATVAALWDSKHFERKLGLPFNIYAIPFDR